MVTGKSHCLWGGRRGTGSLQLVLCLWQGTASLKGADMAKSTQKARTEDMANWMPQESCFVTADLNVPEIRVLDVSILALMLYSVHA